MNKNYLITHSNSLAYSKYSLSINAQKIVMILASLVQPNDNGFKEFEFTVKELAEILGVSKENVYKELPKITRELITKLILFKTNDDNFIQGTFLSTAEYKKSNGKVILEFSPKVAPYLLELKRYFSQYKLFTPLSFKSKYSIRLYQIFKANEIKKNFIISLDDLREILNLQQKSYESFNRLKERVINTSLEEINKTDIYVNFETIKTGKKVTYLKFYIKENKNLSNDNEIQLINEKLETNENIKELKHLFKKHKISAENLSKIYESSGKNIEKVKKVYEYSKTQKIDNLVGFMIKMVKDNNFQESIKQYKYNKLHNFTEREDYDYENLEKCLLGWTDNENNIFDNNTQQFEEAKSEFNSIENKNNIYLIDTVKSVLECQLTAIFGELRYRTWIKPSIDNIEIEDNNVKFIFLNEFMKKKFSNEFENIIKEIILEIDENLMLKKC
ncbi:initiator RepB protein family [Clostridium perfringens D str. JGS1721]|uniref:Initiator RepB protein family n=1 Tax=Clostridium perfringens D str. JGS1721 TaxID=488537 RepID=B1V636_CLOPF|nr:replication initiation protein [Clostridium perfringens]EDT70718.1 initiator RepB protein family [Clostridium perfringens D str. JGS1721]